ncbi:beta-lactamase/transpeptidase-like protein [Aspergillus carlsbadensis]|nr:beta-lactamase/transpeptidase-like protein [Aspergillus carlsbadensis]
MRFLSLLALSAHGILASGTSICPPTGPVLPPPRIPQDYDWPNLTRTLDQFIQNSVEDGWNGTINSFSVMATSAEETFFSYHHTAPLKNESGVQRVDGDTVYAIASITKVFTVLAVWLEDRMNLDDPIGWYVQELNSSGWEDVTLRLLTSQIAAIPRNGYTFDNAQNAPDLVELGFPELQPSDIPPCSLAPGLRMCTREELFASFSGFEFTGAIGDRAAYSDLAYILLGYALEDVTGLPYKQLLKKSILDPLGLNDTTAFRPDPARMIIPSEGAFWIDVDWAYYLKTAGLYSTPNDLSTFTRAILTNKLLTRAKTNEWLKPAAFASQLDKSVGAPWEIFRPTTLLDNDTRPIDHYTKSGDVPGFSSSYLVLVPEYNLGVTILGAGLDASTVVPLLLDTVQAVLIPALDQLAREQAVEQYVGIYTSTSGNESAALQLVVDSGPGLKVARWNKGDLDMLKSLAVALFGGSPHKALPADIRFYPTGLDHRWYVGFTEQTIGRTGEDDKHRGALRGSACMDWYRVDQFHYGKRRLDEVVFRMASDGTVEGLEVPALRESFVKE